VYENIGGKIKGFAKFIAWFGIIGSVIGGIAMISQGSNYYRSSNPMMLPGILTIIAGSLASWISSWFTYGFGELIEKTSEIAANTARAASADK